MRETEIAWTDSTFNPWWGCVKVSEGCRNCYAETFDRRVHGIGKGHWGPKAEHRRFGDKHWNEPLRWNAEAAKTGKPHRVFCASMADVFEGRPEDSADRARLWTLIDETPALTWLLLTKRPENMTRFAPPRWHDRWPRNVLAGCTVEDQENADRRIPELLRVPAAVRFLSVEPMLGAVDLTEWLGVNCHDRMEAHGKRCPDHETAWECPPDEWWCDTCGVAEMGGKPAGLGAPPMGVNWIIVGGESGPGARPFDLRWAASVSEQCKAAGVPYFFKQAGARPVADTGAHGIKALCLNDRKGGDLVEIQNLIGWDALPDVFRREWPEPRQ